MKQSENEIVPLCPICIRELEATSLTDGGWNCRCGEFIPEGLQVSPRVQPAKGPVTAPEFAPAVSEKAALKGKIRRY